MMTQSAMTHALTDVWEWAEYTKTPKWDFGEAEYFGVEDVMTFQTTCGDGGSRDFTKAEIVDFLTKEMTAMKFATMKDPERDSVWLVKNTGSRRYKFFRRSPDYMAKRRAKEAKAKAVKTEVRVADVVVEVAPITLEQYNETLARVVAIEEVENVVWDEVGLVYHARRKANVVAMKAMKERAEAKAMK